MKKILFLVNHEVVIYNFRLELIERLLDEGYEVFISSPSGEKINKLVQLGCQHINLDIDRHGTNFVSEIKLIYYYYRLFKKIKPTIVLSYTIKPNIYGGIISRLLNVPQISNVTGLGQSIRNNILLRYILIFLYKISFKRNLKVFFQNNNDLDFFISNNIKINNYGLLPGSGVNLKRFPVLEYPKDKEVNFIFISRIMKDKGINELLEAAKVIKQNHPNVKFDICGFIEEKYEDILADNESKGIIRYHGMVANVRNFLRKSHCLIHPSYHEGMSNVILEAAASGRPVIASNIPGCQEIFDEGISGIGFEAKNAKDLIRAIEDFLKLSTKDKEKMGLAGRRKVEREFDRDIVVDAYMKEIENMECDSNEFI